MTNNGKVIFGATVDIEDVNTGDTKPYQIVGEDEADAHHHGGAGPRLPDEAVEPVHVRHGPELEDVRRVVPGQGRHDGAAPLRQHEPVFLSGLGPQPLHDFVRQYAGLSLKRPITVGSGYGARGSGVAGRVGEHDVRVGRPEWIGVGASHQTGWTGLVATLLADAGPEMP